MSARGLLIANGVSANGGAAKDGGRYSIHDIVLDDVQPGLYNGSGAFCPDLHDARHFRITATSRRQN